MSNCWSFAIVAKAASVITLVTGGTVAVANLAALNNLSN